MKKAFTFLKNNVSILFLACYLLSLLVYIVPSLSALTVQGIIFRLLSGIIILFIGLFVFSANCSFRKFEICLFAVISIIFLTNTIFYCFGFYNNKINANNLVISFLRFGACSLMLYCTLRLIENKPNNKFILVSLILLGLISVLYSFIFEFPKIKEMLLSNEGQNIDITSFFINKNIYGFVLFISIAATLIFMAKNHYQNVFKALIFIILMVGLILSRSKTPMILSIILLGYYVFKNVALMKNNKKLLILSLFSLLILATFIILIFSINNSFFLVLKRFVCHTLIDDGIVVLKSRFNKMRIILSSFGIKEFLIGYGLQYESTLLKDLNFISIDNYYLKLLIDGGIILFLIYTIVISYLYIRLIKNRNILAIILLTLFNLYSLFEDVGIFSASFCSYSFLILLMETNLLINSNNKISK